MCPYFAVTKNKGISWLQYMGEPQLLKQLLYNTETFFQIY